jgi:hypothetical protein
MTPPCSSFDRDLGDDGSISTHIGARNTEFRSGFRGLRDVLTEGTPADGSRTVRELLQPLQNPMVDRSRLIVSCGGGIPPGTGLDRNLKETGNSGATLCVTLLKPL